MEINHYKYRSYETSALISLEASLDYHDPALVVEICHRAGLLSEAFEASDGETFEQVLDRAIEILTEDILDELDTVSL